MSFRVIDSWSETGRIKALIGKNKMITISFILGPKWDFLSGLMSVPVLRPGAV